MIGFSPRRAWRFSIPRAARKLLPSIRESRSPRSRCERSDTSCRSARLNLFLCLSVCCIWTPAELRLARLGSARRMGGRGKPRRERRHPRGRNWSTRAADAGADANAEAAHTCLAAAFASPDRRPAHGWHSFVSDETRRDAPSPVGCQRGAQWRYCFARRRSSCLPASLQLSRNSDCFCHRHFGFSSRFSSSLCLRLCLCLRPAHPMHPTQPTHPTPKIGSLRQRNGQRGRENCEHHHRLPAASMCVARLSPREPAASPAARPDFAAHLR